MKLRIKQKSIIASIKLKLKSLGIARQFRVNVLDQEIADLSLTKEMRTLHVVMRMNPEQTESYKHKVG